MSESLTPGAINLLNTMVLSSCEQTTDDYVGKHLDDLPLMRGYQKLRRLEQFVRMALEDGYEFSWENLYKNSKGHLCKNDFNIFPELQEAKKVASEAIS